MKIVNNIIITLCLVAVSIGVMGAKFVENEILIKSTEPLTGIQTLSGPSLKSRYKIKNIKRFGKKRALKKPTKRSTKNNNPLSIAQTERSYTLAFEKNIDIKDTIEKLKTESYITHAQPNYIYEAYLTPNDEFFADNQPELITMDAPTAWDITTGLATVVIAIIDTGVSPNHEDLSGTLWTNTSEIASNNIDDDNNGYIDDINGYNFVDNTGTLTDVQGHGTHVSGTAGASLNNSIGIAGTCGGCSLMILQAGDSEGLFTTDNLVNALNYAASQNADIINMSLGGSGDIDPIFQTAVNEALDDGIVVVVAAGNDSQDIEDNVVTPAIYDGVITVSAAKNSGNFDTTYSNFGSSVDIMATGTRVASTYPINITGEPYAVLSGTSMATPYVAGTAGLILSVDSDISSENVYQILTKSATDKQAAGYDIYSGNGYLNIGLAVTYAVALSNDTTAPTLSHTQTTTDIFHGYDTTLELLVTDNIHFVTPSITMSYSFYNADTATSSWTEIPVSQTAADATGITTQVTLPGSEDFDDTKINYFFTAIDGQENTTYLPTATSSNPYIITLNEDTVSPSITVESISTWDFLTDLTIEATVTDNITFVSPSVSIVYSYYNSNTETQSDWTTLTGSQSGDVFSNTIPGGSTANTHIYYFVRAVDARDNIQLEPTTATSNPTSIELVDLSAPVVSFELISNDYLTQEGSLTITVSDNIQVSVNSIQATIEDSSGANTYSVTQNPTILEFSDTTLTLNMETLSIDTDDTVDITVTAEDIAGNAVSTTLTFLTASSINLYGPEGSSSPVINVPNPFDPNDESTFFWYQATKDAYLTIDIYTLNLQKIKSISRAIYAGPTDKEDIWNGTDSAGDPVPNGAYIAVIQAKADGVTVTKRIKIAVLRD